MSITIKKNKGSLIVFTGPMFSGKTSALIRKQKELDQQKHSLIAFKPALDNRYSDSDIVSHDKEKIVAYTIEDLHDMQEIIKLYDCILIDEAQFLPPNTIDEIIHWRDEGKKVLVAGLNMDYLAKPFGIMEKLIDLADETFFLNGICDICNNPSTNTFRKSTDKELILIGEKASYSSLCNTCFLENIKTHENNN